MNEVNNNIQPEDNKKSNSRLIICVVIIMVVLIATITIYLLSQHKKTSNNNSDKDDSTYNITEAKKSATESSAYGYIDAINNNNMLADVSGDLDVGETYTPVTTGDVSTANANLGNHLKGNAPESGKITIDSSGKVISAELYFGNFICTYNNETVTCKGK